MDFQWKTFNQRSSVIQGALKAVESRIECFETCKIGIYPEKASRKFILLEFLFRTCRLEIDNVVAIIIQVKIKYFLVEKLETVPRRESVQTFFHLYSLVSWWSGSWNLCPTYWKKLFHSHKYSSHGVGIMWTVGCNYTRKKSLIDLCWSKARSKEQ